MSRLEIRGSRTDDKPLRGQDIRVVLVGRDGVEHLIPALSLTLRVGGRGELAIATITVPAVLVDLQGVRIETVADVSPQGPESQWEEVIGHRPGDVVADADAAVTAMAELDAAIAALESGTPL